MARDAVEHAREAAAGWQPLNPFQQLVRRWNRLAPYNAVQAMRVSGRADGERWRDAAARVVRETGLGVPAFDACGRHVRFDAAPSVDLQRPVDFQRHVAGELNRPFKAGDFPLRFFIADGRDGSHYFGATYDHWIADSVAMRELMRRAWLAYTGDASASSLAALTTRLPARPLGRGGPSVRGACFGLRTLLRHRKAWRPALENPQDFASRWFHLEVEAGVIDGVRRAARRLGVSVHDVITACLAQSLGAFSRDGRERHPRRKAVGVAAIADLRTAARVPLEGVFGFFLGLFTAAVERPESRAWEELAVDLARRTAFAKSPAGARLALANVATLCRFWDACRRDRSRALFFNKHLPVMAALSNVNLRGTWVEAAVEDGARSGSAGPRLLDYVRVSPTGPVAPLLVTPTTLGGRMGVAFTYRTTAFNEGQARRIAEDFCDRLHTAAGVARRTGARAEMALPVEPRLHRTEAVA